MINDQNIQETTLTLQEIMLDILRRRSVIEALEEQAIGKIPQDDSTIRLLAADYLRSQLSDLRKFFETDGRSHRMSDLTTILPTTSQSRQKHETLFQKWKNTYEDVSNQYFFHREKNYTPPLGLSPSELNHFIDDLNIILDELIHDLTKNSFAVGYVSREPEYFQEIKADARKFFSAI